MFSAGNVGIQESIAVLFNAGVIYVYSLLLMLRTLHGAKCCLSFVNAGASYLFAMGMISLMLERSI
jgi:hypothetical protein